MTLFQLGISAVFRYIWENMSVKLSLNKGSMIYSFQLGILHKYHLAKLPETSQDEKLTRHGAAAVRLTNSGDVRKEYGEVEYTYCSMCHIVNLRAV